MKKAEIRTLVDHFDHVRAQNTYEWAKDIRVTGGDPGHIEMTFTTDIRRHANLRGDLHGAVCGTYHGAGHYNSSMAERIQTEEAE